MEATEFITIGSVLVTIASGIAALVATQRANARIAQFEKMEAARRRERTEAHAREHEDTEKRYQGLIHQLAKGDSEMRRMLAIGESRFAVLDEAVREALMAGGEVSPEFLKEFTRRAPHLIDYYLRRMPLDFERNHVKDKEE